MSEPSIVVHICPDAPPEKCLLLAKHLLQRSGRAAEIAALLKASGTVWRRRASALPDTALRPLRPPALDLLWHALAAWGDSWPLLLAHRLQLLIEGQEEGLHKARGRRWHFPWLAEQWAAFRATMAALSRQVLHWLTARKALTPAAAEQLRLPQQVEDVFGQAAQQGMAHTLPLTASEQAAIAYVRQHADARLRPVFTALEARIEARMIAIERQRVREAVGTALQPQQALPQLPSVLGDLAGQWQREWARVARTELQEAHNQGAVAALIARHPRNIRNGQPVDAPRIPDVRVYKIPSENACVHCLRIWLYPDHTPRLYWLADVLANPSNEGKPAAAWVAQVGPIHPNCTEGGLLVYTGLSEVTFKKMRKRENMRTAAEGAHIYAGKRGKN